ncbi:MAG TPA: hypothetical protein VFX51_20545 [Solirubrobacteraceae bacterium]|nr:hypothetical protein [Solirubrobacteraceae bacterium]
MSNLPDALLRYRHQLEQAVTADVARRRRRTRLGAVAAILGLTVIVLNVIPSGGSDRRLPSVEPASAVERAAAALKSDRRTILHVRMEGRQYDETRPDIRWVNESWVGAGAYRMVETPPDGPVAETEQAKGFDRIWDGERVLETPAADDEMSTSPEDKFRAEALQYLRGGHARVTGQVRRGGREALRIVADGGDQVFIVDAHDYTPMEFRTRGTGGGTVLRFVIYERLPVTAETRALLSISAQHGNAPVVRDPAAYQDAVARMFPHG